MRRAASWTHPRQESSAPRGARTMRADRAMRERALLPRVAGVESYLETMAVFARERSRVHILDRLGLAQPYVGLRAVAQRGQGEAAIERVLGALRVVPGAAVAFERRQGLLCLGVSALVELGPAFRERAPARDQERQEHGEGRHTHHEAPILTPSPPLTHPSCALRPRTVP